MPDQPRAQLDQTALEHAMASAGPVILYSGFTVLIGMCGLLATPLVETRSLGLGGCIVVAMAMALALTLPPQTPLRSLIQLTVYGVVLVTLVGQGLCLRFLLPRLSAAQVAA